EGRPILACELDADALVARRRIDFRVEEPGRFPSVYLDLSVAVSMSVPFGALIDEAVASSDDLLQDVSVFDVYSGDGIPRSHCAIGLRLTIGAPDRTLTTAEAEAVRERMVARLHDKFGAIRR
ncbi:MAG: phenylalanine--tRNA ligase subunit beta, partial [Actinomycetota bacterium]